MTDINNPDSQTDSQKEPESQKRIKELSDKVELTSKERDEKEALLRERDSKIAQLEKENSFNSGFSDILSAHPNAHTHKDAIKEKVMAGYSVEDATYAVLGKVGALGGTRVEPKSPAGGSADTVMTHAVDKKPSEMTQDERRAILEKDLVFSQ